MPKLLLGQFMTRGIETLAPDAFVTELVDRMHAGKLSCVVVTERGKPVGIVSERDCVGWLAEVMRGRDLSAVTVAEVMSAPVISVTRDTSWLDALDIARRRRVRRLPVVDDHGALVGLVTQGDLLQAQRLAFQSQREELEVRVAERTRELSLARDEAEAMLRANLGFLATMTHELRTPLGGVVSVAELLRDTRLGPQQSEWVSTIIGAGRSLVSLVNDILDYTKMESCQVQVEHIPFDLLDLLEEVADLSALKAQSKGVAFRLAYDPLAPSALVGDPARIRQVLTNLCGNAVKFTDSGEVAVHVTYPRREGDRGRLRIEVRDTGVGVPHDQQAKLFHAYSQADASIHRRFGGTGLGLAITRQLVEAMGGEVGVRSAPEVGSTFWFELDVTFGASAPPLRKTGAQAIIIDENPATATDLRNLLSAMGVAARCFDRVAPAHAAFNAGEDFAVAFVRFPVADREERRRLDALRVALGQAPICLVTDIADHAMAAAMTPQGYASALTRPVKRRPLRDALVNVIEVPDARQIAPVLPTRRKIARENARILLAEDNKVNQMVLQHQLRKLGFDCQVVDDGKQALIAFRERRWDVVLMDYRMPVMDGIAATHAMRAFEAEQGLARTTILALTASIAPRERADCLAAGMDAFLTKPLDAEGIERALARHLAIDGGCPLSPSQADALAELIHIGAGLAAENLSAMAGSAVALTVPSIRPAADCSLKQVLGSFAGDDWLCVEEGFTGALAGRAALLLPEQGARSLVTALGDLEQGAAISTAQHREQAVIAIGNLLLNGLVGTVGDALGGRVDFDLPTFVRGSVARLLATEQYLGQPNFLLARTRFAVSGLDVGGLVVMLLGPESIEQLRARLERRRSGAAPSGRANVCAV